MFITLPQSILLELDLPILIDMLSELTLEYSQSTRSDGITSNSEVLRHYIINIQLAIETKKMAEKIPVVARNENTALSMTGS